MDIKKGELVLKASGWNHLVVPAPNESIFAITGAESQAVTFSLPPGEKVSAEPGTMMYFTQGTKPSIKCEGFFGRCCAGEACYNVNYTNEGEHGGKSYIALTPNFPTAKVVPINLSDANVGGQLICQQGAFMASYGEVVIGASFDFNLKRCCCAGTGMVRQKLEGSGTAFLASTGTILQKVLEPGEIIVMDTNCVLAFSGSCKLDIKQAGNVIGWFGGGEGIFNTTLEGPGLVLVQSMNQITFRESLAAQKLWRR